MCKWLLAGAFSAMLGVNQAAPPQIERVQEWIEAVSNHEPGLWDRPAQTLASWSTAELESLFPYVKALAELIGTGEYKPGWAVFAAAEGELLENLAARTRGSDLNRIMKRGALLHSDVAMTTQVDEEHVPPPPPLSRVPNRVGARFTLPRRPTVISEDGRYEAFGREAIHWDFARMLLDAVRPAPSSDGMVRLWYQAIATHFAGRYKLAQALHHLEPGRRLFPDDPDLLFDSGCLHETFAAPRVQTLIQTTTLPNERRIAVAGVSPNLREAERYFREALERNPNLAEARIRLARVLLKRGRHESARAELQRALEATSDTLLLYYAQLFLADAERSLGGFEAARKAYEKAAELYPRAQSPYLGLSHLARRTGDRAAALRAIQQVLSLQADEREREDPWWRYHECGGRAADALLVRLRAPFRDVRK